MGNEEAEQEPRLVLPEQPGPAQPGPAQLFPQMGLPAVQEKALLFERSRRSEC